MKIEIERINNGWLVSFATGPSASDPLAQRGPRGQTFHDTRESLCGAIAEQVLALPDGQEGTPS